jgi:hypothetical protein
MIAGWFINDLNEPAEVIQYVLDNYEKLQPACGKIVLTNTENSSKPLEKMFEKF